LTKVNGDTVAPADHAAIPPPKAPPMDAPIARNSLCLGGLLARHARYRRHHAAVVVPGDREVRLDWGEFNAYVNRWANALTGLGVRRGDRVATLLGNGIELIATYWACAKLGAAIVPLSPLLTAAGVRSLMTDAPPAAVVSSSMHRAALLEVRDVLAASTAWVLTDDDESEHFRAYGTLVAQASDAEPKAEVDSGDLLTLMYTSGTTGMPKGIQHTHFIRAMYANISRRLDCEIITTSKEVRPVP